VALYVNGQAVGSQSVAPGLRPVDFEVRQPSLFRPGENDVELRLRRRGAHRSYGLWHSVVVSPTERRSHKRPRTPVGDGTALRGFSRFRLYLELPRDGFFAFTTATLDAAARFQVTLTDVKGARKALLEQRLEARQQRRHRLSLRGFSNQLVVLDLETDAPASAAWISPSITLPQVKPLTRPAAVQNAIVLVIDALRADRLRSYNPKTPVQTPRISTDTDKRGIVFAFNQAASPSSPPSHGSIQTGMIPRVHGAASDKGKLKPGTPLLSTQVRAAGLAVGYFGNNPFGMARLERPGRWTEFVQPVREGKGADCTTLMDLILGFASRQKRAGKRFVVSSLPFEPHTPYRYHPGLSDKYYPGPFVAPVGKHVDGGLLSDVTSGKVELSAAQWRQLEALYNGEVEHMDRCYGQLVDGLAQRGLREGTALIVTADHGEGMFEHGRLGHAYGHWGELTDVPMILLVPGWPARSVRIDTVSSHLDLLPTLLDLLGVPVSPRVQGRSLLPLVLRRGSWTPRVVSSEYGRSYSLRARRWRYIVDYDGSEQLFDLRHDPKEQRSVVKRAPIALRYLREAAGFFLAYRRDWRVEHWGDYNNHSERFAREVELSKPAQRRLR
jgi:arylsulfatase A-like enzyme